MTHGDSSRCIQIERRNRRGGRMLSLVDLLNHRVIIKWEGDRESDK